MHKSLILTMPILAVGMLALAACSKHQVARSPIQTSAKATAISAAPMTSAAAATTAAPSGSIGAAEGTLGTAPSPGTAIIAKLSHVVYVASIRPMNDGVVKRNFTEGKAQFAINDGELTIRIRVTGSPPDIEHLQHIHGFVSGKAAHCPTSAADKNNDGFIDITETRAVSGVPMIPLNDDPATAEGVVANGTYPEASADGDYTYQETVSLNALQTVFGMEFKGARLNLAKRVIFIQGASEETELPASVSSLPAIPADILLPIACGEIKAVSQAASGPSS